MSKRLDEKVGVQKYDGLIVQPYPTADVVTVQLAASQGILSRGTVITGTAGGELSHATAALEASGAVYILAEDTDTGTSGAVTTTAYRTGHFARSRLKTDGSYTLTAADEEILRKSGILVSDAMDY